MSSAHNLFSVLGGKRERTLCNFQSSSVQTSVVMHKMQYMHVVNPLIYFSIHRRAGE